jgi:phosphonatase-like hydrolase
MIALVVFDIAGTTIQDGDAVHTCLRRVLQTRGVDVDRDAVNRVMGEPKPVAIAKLLSWSRGRPYDPRDADVSSVHDAFEQLMMEYYAADTTVVLAPDAEATFAALKQRGIRIALDTGFNRAIVDVILRRFNWAGSGLIDATVASDEVARGRPAPDLIERAMALTGVASAAAVAKVGDTPADLQEGTAAGCARVIGLTTGSHTREQLRAHPHTHLVEALAEVPPLCLEGAVE